MAWTRLIFLGSLFVLFSCSKTKVQGASAAASLILKNVNCTAGDFGLLSTEMAKATSQVLSCLKTYNRVQDAANYQKIIVGQTINIQCVDDKKGSVARAYGEFHPLAPGMSIQMNKFKTQFSYAEFMKTLTHETIHWLRYLHYQDVDLAYIVENCCSAEDTNQGMNLKQKACGLFRFQNKSDFLNPSYIEEINEVLVDTDFERIGFKTVLMSAIQATTTPEYGQKSDRVDRILNAPVKLYFENLMLNEDDNIKSWAKPQLIYYMILTGILKHSKVSDVAATNRFRQQVIIGRFFKTDAGLKKLNSMSLISDFLEPVIRDQGFAVRFMFRNLNRQRDEICSRLDQEEAAIITDILDQVTIEALDKISFASTESQYFSLLKTPDDPETRLILTVLREFCKPALVAR